MSKIQDKEFMKEALKQAKKAFQKNEVPVGAIIVKKEKVLAKAYNKSEALNSPLEHAEIRALKKAFKIEKDWRLTQCNIYVTLEPCEMCLGALKAARIKEVFYAAPNTQTQKRKSLKNIKLKQIKGDLEKESSNLLKSFF